jgi:hypothetical protein
MWIDAVDLLDVRAIHRCSIRLPRPGDDHLEYPNMTVLLGGNGVGKSTLLRAIGLATLVDTPQLDTALGDAARWPRTGADAPARAEVTMRPTDPGGSGRTVATGFTIAPGGGLDTWTTGDRSRALVVGYGADRAAGRLGEATGVAPQRMASLFGGDAVTIAGTTWLSRALSEDDGDLRETLVALLPPGITIGPVDATPDDLFASRGVPTPYDGLSDGVRSYLSWLVDLLHHLQQAAGDGNVRDVPAVALVDEIDQRMHAEWQQALVSRLGSVLPRVQFIATAHGALVAAGLRPENLLLLEQVFHGPGAGGMVVRRLREDVFGATADVALTSSYFQLTSPRSASFQQQLRRSAAAAADSDEAVADFMAALLSAEGLGPTAGRPTRDRPEHLRRRRP